MKTNHNSDQPAVKQNGQVDGMLNVILITLDTFNHELFDSNIDNLPNLKQIVRGSVSFENAFSIGPSTFFAVPGIIASVYPYHFGIGIHKSVDALDKIMKNQGYNTAFINDLNVLLTPYFGYCMNTDYQKHIFNLSDTGRDRTIADSLLYAEYTEKTRSHLRSHNLLKKIYYKVDIEWLKNFGVFWLKIYRFIKLCLKEQGVSVKDRRKLYSRFRHEVLEFLNVKFKSPQYLWIHTAINHLPYLLPETNSKFETLKVNYLNYRGLSDLVNPAICRNLKRLYLESMKTTDDLIGEIVSLLDNQGLLQNTIIIVTSDHGEEFLEDGYFGHTEGSSSDNLLHVPLFFYCPTVLQPNRITIPVSTIDIIPTICDLLSIPIPDSTRGMSLKHLMLNAGADSESYQKFNNRSLFSESWKTQGLLDRSSGHDSIKKIFTVRNGPYKLKLIREKKDEHRIIERHELVDWIRNEKLDLKDNSDIVGRLTHLLDEHIYYEGVFTTSIRREAEKKRLKGTIRRMGGRLQD